MLLNKIQVLTKVICVSCTAMVSLACFNNAVAAEHRLLALGSNKMITLDLQSGAAINIEVWENQQVEILYDDETQALANYAIDIEENNSGLKVSSTALKNGDMQLSFNLKVPEKTQLCLSSGGGNIRVSGLNGALKNCDAASNYNDGSVVINSLGGNVQVNTALEGAHVKTGGGNINIEDASKYVFAETGGGSINIELDNGEVKAHTGAGKIEVKVLNETAQSGDIELSTGLGDVWLYLPKNYSMTLAVEIAYTGDTDGAYNVDSDFPFSLAPTDKQTFSGTPRKYSHGTAIIADGQHSVKIKTTNGNVYIRER
jgi:DUF4097 and DUF4098 domain-containing protein YvlB